uniref:Uncharacterized protein n=1 Tax=Oryza brachyantha TaxID=4533 RepID=J3MIH0_ORYBR
MTHGRVWIVTSYLDRWQLISGWCSVLIPYGTWTWVVHLILKTMAFSLVGRSHFSLICIIVAVNFVDVKPVLYTNLCVSSLTFLVG